MAFTTIDDVLSDRGPVYVRNTSNPVAVLLLAFTDAGGRTRSIKIPKSHLPVDLASHVDHDTISRSNDLRAYLRKGVLSLVARTRAEQELSSPGAQGELERLNLSAYSSRNLDTSRQNPMPALPEIIDETPNTSPVNPAVMQLMIRLDTKDLSPKHALAELRAIEHTLKEADCAYIMNNAGENEQITQFAKTALANMQTGASSVQHHINSPMLPAVDDDDDDDDEDVMTSADRQREQQREAEARAANDASSKAARKAAIREAKKLKRERDG